MRRGRRPLATGYVKGIGCRGPRAGLLLFEARSRSTLLVEHDLFPKTGIHFSGSCSSAPIPKFERARLEPDGTGTRVLFEYTGFEQEQAFKGAEYGWNMMHGKLAKTLAQLRSFQ